MKILEQQEMFNNLYAGNYSFNSFDTSDQSISQYITTIDCRNKQVLQFIKGSLSGYQVFIDLTDDEIYDLWGKMIDQNISIPIEEALVVEIKDFEYNEKFVVAVKDRDILFRYKLIVGF